jgi:hypothetical protein
MTSKPKRHLPSSPSSTASALLAFADAIRPSSNADGHGVDLANARLGHRQREIASLAGLDTDAGLSTSEVAREIDYDAANTHTALYGLAARRIAEGFRHGEHTRWRLTPRYRSANPYLAIARLIAAGEWTPLTTSPSWYTGMSQAGFDGGSVSRFRPRERGAFCYATTEKVSTGAGRGPRHPS